MKTKKNIKMVIVEDSPFFNKTLTKYISSLFNSSAYPQFEFEIKSYLTAHDCIEEFEDDTDIMVVDYYLINDDEPDVLTGLDVVKVANKHSEKCKIVMLSAQQDDVITNQLKSYGVYEYIDKNVNTNNRVGAVLQHILTNEFNEEETIN